jgi:16S rRNA (guanine527-N7)-methyltransferase
VRDDPYTLLNSHVPVSRETVHRLSLYHDLLIKWQSKTNLVSDDSLANAWRRHFLDSLQLLPQLPSLSSIIIDLGSGAGFPGMVLAIAGGSNVHLIESDTKKISFLQEVARVTQTKVHLHHQRIEQVSGLAGDVIVARGCSDLNQLLSYASTFVSHGTICLFHKGKNYSNDISDAKKYWQFDHVIIPSVTDQQGVIIKISHMEGGRHDGKYQSKTAT